MATTRGKRTTAQDTTDAIDAALAANGDDVQPEPAQPATTRRGRARKATTPPPAPAQDDVADVAPDSAPYGLRGFSTRDVPWGKLGNIEGTALTAVDAAKRGGLDFEVELLEAGFRSTVRSSANASPWKVVPHRKAVVRKDNQQFLAFVSKDYPPVQYSEAFAFMDAISPTYVAAGVLGGGRQGFMVVQLPEHKAVELKVGKQVDPLELYVVLRTSHDLTRAIEVSVLTLRMKCMNALTLSSFTSGAVQRWSVKHAGKDPMAKMAEATRALHNAEAYVESFTRTATELAKIKIELEDARQLLTRVLPNKPKRDEQVSAIVTAWRESPTNGFPNDGWGLTNAVSEYFEWGRSDGTRTAQSRFTGGLTGSTHKYTNRTAQLLLQRRR